MKSIIITVFLMVSFIGSAQVNMDDYKYIVVPKRFDGFRNENQHQTSTLIKYLFSKKGFVTIYDDNLPVDLGIDRCLGLYVDLIENSSMFTTKTILALKDCKGQEVFLSQEGRSKSKDYKTAFNEAINEAFESFESLSYTYVPKERTKKEGEPITVSFENDIKKVDAKPDLKKEQERLIKEISTEEVQYYKNRTPIETDIKMADPSTEKKMVEQKATKEEQSFKSMDSVQMDNKEEASVALSKVSSGPLYAQELPNGYQLVDSTPKIQLKIFKSSMPNVYIAKGDGRDGVVYSSDGKWFFEYHEGNQIVKEELNIKF